MFMLMDTVVDHSENFLVLPFDFYKGVKVSFARPSLKTIPNVVFY